MNPIIDIDHVSQVFDLPHHVKLPALQDIHLQLYEGETLGIVGESGCGKTTLGRVLSNIYHPTHGTITYPKRGDKNPHRYIQMVFQSPSAALNPAITVEKIIEEGMEIHNLYKKSERKQRSIELLELVGLRSDCLRRFPTEFSGGQLQRISIARSLAIEPTILVLDEPTSALDVSIQNQMINLLKDIQNKLHLTYVFISHNLSVVRYISDRIVVMYLGYIVEIATSQELFEYPCHPYTKLLLQSITHSSQLSTTDYDIEISSPLQLQGECPFYARCSQAFQACKKHPSFVNISNQHEVACHLYKGNK